eukprot:scaffold4541_cov121-Skeletonema_marinoi.AAC.5
MSTCSSFDTIEILTRLVSHSWIRWTSGQDPTPDMLTFNAVKNLYSLIIRHYIKNLQDKASPFLNTAHGRNTWTGPL